MLIFTYIKKVIFLDVRYSFYIILICALIFAERTSAQNESATAYSAQLTDHKYRPIAGALIKNFRNQQVAITDTSGYFSIEAQVKDSLLVVAMGHEIKVVHIASSTQRHLVLNSLSVQLNLVEVVDQKTWEEFKRNFYKDDIPGEKMNTKGLPENKRNPVPPQYRSNEFSGQGKPSFGNYVMNPFSSIASAINKDEKQKRKMRKIMRDEAGQAIYWRTMSEDSIHSYISIPDSLITDFIVFCNTEIEDKYLESSYYYKEIIIQLYPRFIEERNSRK